MKSVFLIFVVLASSLSVAQNYKVIHSFAGPPDDASYVVSNVIFDAKGNLYGTSANGGTYSMGTVYELSPEAGGQWTEKILYNFCSNNNGVSCLDGASPNAGMAMDAKGNLYGIGFGGSGASGSGGGVLFELSPPTQAGGAWTESVVYNFCSNMQGDLCLDGLAPASQPIFDSSGNLYGTTAGGGTGHLKLGGGTVFKLSPGANGWTEKILYSFCSQGTGDDCPDGEIPTGGVTFDKSGNIFGTTDYSGNVGSPAGGTVYELSPSVHGWKYKRLLEVPSQSKSNTLLGAISLDDFGNLYSTFASPDGGVFKLNPSSRNLDVFSFDGQNGKSPQRGLYFDGKAGAVYGTTAFGGGSGNIYRINNNRHETILYNFCALPNCADGELPWPAPVPDKAGNLYGTTEFGGEYGAGVVFEIAP